VDLDVLIKVGWSTMEGSRPSNPPCGADALIATRGRVIVVDDDVLFREGLVLLLGRSGFEVVALEELSEREREVLALMAEGRTNASIARKLSVREGTVEK
jgi:DNA-binding NarL/FixJ family response regulator